MFMRFFQRALPIRYHGSLDNLVAQGPESAAGIGRGIDLTGQLQAIQVVLGKEAVARWCPLDGWDQSPVHITADGVRVNARGPGDLRGMHKFLWHDAAKSVPSSSHLPAKQMSHIITAHPYIFPIAA